MSGVEVCQVTGYERGQTKGSEKPSQLSSLAAECVCVCVCVCPGGGPASLRPALVCYLKTDQQMAGVLRESQGQLVGEEERQTQSALVSLGLHSKIP